MARRTFVGRSKKQAAAAIEKMTLEQHTDMKSWARRLMGEQLVRGRDFEDLYLESLAATLGQKRNWPFKVPLETFLKNAMRGILSTWRHNADNSLEVQETASSYDSDDCD